MNNIIKRKIEKDYIDKYGLKNYYFEIKEIRHIDSYSLKFNYGCVFIDLVISNITDDLFLFILYKNLLDKITSKYILRWFGTEIDYKSIKQRSVSYLGFNFETLDLFMNYVTITERDFYSKKYGLK